MNPDGTLCQNSCSGLTGGAVSAASPVLLWPERIEQIREFLTLYHELAIHDDLTWVRSFIKGLLVDVDRMSSRAEIAIKDAGYKR